MVTTLISFAVEILTILIILHVVFSYFLAPYHPLRQAIDRLLDPLLQPIRRLVSPAGGFDFSSLILILLIQVIGSILVRLLRGL